MEKKVKVFFYFFIAAIPLGYRVLAYKFIPGFQEYEAAFFCLSDVFLVAFLFFAVLLLKKSFFYNKVSWLAILFLTSEVMAIIFAPLKLLAVYRFFRLALYVFLAIVAGILLKEKIIKREKVFAIFGGMAVLESVLAFWQFKLQSHIGLRFLGEQKIGVGIVGISKMSVAGVDLVRPYGTFLHPNILGAFLVLGFFAIAYFFVKKEKINIPLLAFLYAVSLGVVLTFSRAAWMGWIAALLFFSLTIIKEKNNIKRSVVIASLWFTMMAAFIPVFPLAGSRAKITLNQESVIERMSYTKQAVEIIKENFLGIGMGNYVPYSFYNGVYEKAGMKNFWEWQPAHNIYLLAAVETGVIGLVLFLALSLKGVLKKRKEDNFEKKYLEAGIIKSVLLGFLIMGMFDHFFWTMETGEMMWWIVVGLSF